jgi:beta-lactamase class D
MTARVGAIAMLLTTTTISGQAQADHECFVFARLKDAAPFVSDAAECAVPASPASTFKIPHALIALQTGVIQPTSAFKWDGTAYEYETWRRDHTLDTAIKWSVRPVFDRTARLIGRTRMREALASFGYAADAFDGDGTTFWVDGDLVVSPLEQLAFLRRFFANNLPVDARHLSVVREALRTPPGEITLGAGVRPFVLDWPGATIVRAKTGNTTVKGERVSWLIGALELNGETWVFAARARARGTLAPTAGADVARRGLNASAPKPASARRAVTVDDLMAHAGSLADLARQSAAEDRASTRCTTSARSLIV